MRVVLTRPEGQNEQLAARLRELGLDVLVCPLVSLEPLGDEPIELGGYDWLVVTSANGAAELARRARGRPRHVAAVGPATAEALRANGFAVDLVPSRWTQEGLVAELPDSPGRVLVAAAEGARPFLVEQTGADFVPLYRTTERHPEDFPEADLAVVASGSASRALAAVCPGLPVVSIGPVTTDAAQAAGLEVVGEADRADLDGLADAVARAAAR